MMMASSTTMPMARIRRTGHRLIVKRGGHGDEGADNGDRTVVAGTSVLGSSGGHEITMSTGNGDEESPYTPRWLPTKRWCRTGWSTSSLGKLLAHLRHGLVHEVATAMTLLPQGNTKIWVICDQ